MFVFTEQGYNGIYEWASMTKSKAYSYYIYIIGDAFMPYFHMPFRWATTLESAASFTLHAFSFHYTPCHFLFFTFFFCSAFIYYYIFTPAGVFLFPLPFFFIHDGGFLCVFFIFHTLLPSLFGDIFRLIRYYYDIVFAAAMSFHCSLPMITYHFSSSMIWGFFFLSFFSRLFVSPEIIIDMVSLYIYYEKLNIFSPHGDILYICFLFACSCLYYIDILFLSFRFSLAVYFRFLSIA